MGVEQVHTQRNRKYGYNFLDKEEDTWTTLLNNRQQPHSKATYDFNKTIVTKYIMLGACWITYDYSGMLLFEHLA